jgi:calcineurin-like phosphoesterase family protein
MNFLNYFWEPLKFEHTNVWFWSDLHIGHRCEYWEVPLWKNRGFSSVEEHDRTLIERWNKNITLESVVFLLGDIMFGQNGRQRLKDLFFDLNFKEIYLLGGNHYAGFKQHLSDSYIQDGVRYQSYGYKTVYFCPNYIEVFVCGQPIVVSHYPLASWNGQAKGSFMVHGHCHGNLYKSEVGKILYKHCKILDVGIENQPYPISFSKLRTYFKDKDNIAFDHHTTEVSTPFCV